LQSVTYNQRYFKVEEYVNPGAVDVIEDETGELLMIKLSALNFEKKEAKTRLTCAAVIRAPVSMNRMTAFENPLAWIVFPDSLRTWYRAYLEHRKVSKNKSQSTEK
jgi:hypothetical protein